MSEKKPYTEPELEVTEFGEDIITASGEWLDEDPISNP